MRTITLEEHCDGEHATTLGSKELSMTSTTTSRSAGGRSSLLTARRWPAWPTSWPGSRVWPCGRGGRGRLRGVGDGRLQRPPGR